VKEGRTRRLLLQIWVRQSDVFVQGSLKNRRAQRIIAAGEERISTVVVDGESFRSLGLAQEAEMC
jgi:hypothetical protein